MKKVIVYFIVPLILAIFIFLWQRYDNQLRLVMCDVGQGDAILVKKGNVEILMDTGPSEKVLSCLSQQMPFWDNKIELVLISHWQKDHAGSLESILKRYQVGTLAVTPIEIEAIKRLPINKTVEIGGVKLVGVKAGDSLKLGLLKLKVLWPYMMEVLPGQTPSMVDQTQRLSPQTVSSVNSTSLDSRQKAEKTEVFPENDDNQQAMVVEGSYKNRSFLLTSDVSTREELAILGLGVITPAEVLKVAHHGSKFSTGSEFLAVVRPQIALVSVGKNNTYGHPTPEALRRLDEVKAKIFRSDLEGTVVLIGGNRGWIRE
jgi:competence protein ComEC